MNKKIVSVLLSAVMVASMVTGCGSTAEAPASTGSTETTAAESAPADEPKAETPAADTAADTAAETPAASGDVEEITFMVWDDLEASSDLITKGYKDSIDRFNADFEGQYHCTPITTNLEEYYTKLNALVAAGETPDVFIVSPGPNLDDYVLPGVAAKLDDALADGWKDTFTSDAVFAGGTYGSEAPSGEGIYAVPLNIAAACVFYNTEMFEAAGAAVPKTFDELLDACQKLKDAGYTPITISAGTAWCLSMVAGYLCDRNGLNLDDVAAHNTDWMDEKVINAGKQIQQLSAYFQPTAAGDDNDIATAAFYNGEAAILIQGSWAIGQINGNCEEGFADKVGVFAFPAVTGSSADPNRVIAKSDSLAMSATSAHPEAAVQLMKYFTDDTAQKYTAEVGGKIPVTSVQYDAAVAPPELAYVMEVFKSANATFGFYNESLADTEAGSTFDNCFVEIFKGEDPATALQPIQDYYEMNVW
ncbi:MAG: extracellular solute-binding protein [Lachnospiraceae bacterium]|nr:extracellular solute-binding protein [Lachnospiraceae bacterium]